MTSSRRDKPAGKALVPLPAIIADIGGTNARFAFVGRDGRAEPWRVPSRNTNLGDALWTWSFQGAERRGRRCWRWPGCAGRAGRTLTVVAEPRRLIAQTGLAEIVILNDFEALALSLPFLAGKDLAKIGTGKQEPLGTRLVIGPGTGLGAAGLIHADGCWAPVRGEGGHIDFGPRTERDFMLWRHLAPPGGRAARRKASCPAPGSCACTVRSRRAAAPVSATTRRRR
jgi:glucokinase